MSSELTVGLAQIDARLGDVEANVERHLELIQQAREQECRLLVFPELSLTGYRLLHLTPQVALQADDPVLERLAEAAGAMTVVVGFVERDARGRLHNSAACLAGGQVAAVQRKLHLPTYGIFQEGRFFVPGERLELMDLAGAPGGVIICEDLWHPEPARRLARAGALVLTVTSAGPGRLGPDAEPPSQNTWETLTRQAAIVNTAWVLYANRVGWEEGSFYGGGSHVVEPGGRVVARAALLDEQLLTVTIDLQEAIRQRQRVPLLATERLDFEGPA